MKKKAHTTRGDFLPDLCSVEAVFHLVIVGELLAIALSVADRGVIRFDWYDLGLTSIMIQWIVLSCAACLCPLREWFREQSLEVAASVSYLIVIAMTVLFTVLGMGLQAGEWVLDWDTIGSNFVLAAVFAGVMLRYFFIQQQLRNQQQAELRSRIQALQSRIRPHFLFNSMNSIASLIEIDPPLAEKMVEDLSDLFRASLSEPGLVPLAKEIDLCRRFAGIEQSRLGPRLNVDWRIDDIPPNTVIPSLLLQPLLENAIYHGIQPLPDGGTVGVKVTIHDEQCMIVMTNPPAPEFKARGGGNGVAIDNIKHRLEAYYGDAAGMNISVTENLYSVFLQFPLTSPEKSREDPAKL